MNFERSMFDVLGIDNIPTTKLPTRARMEEPPGDAIRSQPCGTMRENQITSPEDSDET